MPDAERVLVSERIGQLFHEGEGSRDRLEFTEYGAGDAWVVLIHGQLMPRRMHEPLARALEAGHVQRVNLALCRHLHGAVVQALLSFPCRLEGDATEGYLTRLVLPALAEARERTAADPSEGQHSMERPE